MGVLIVLERFSGVRIEDEKLFNGVLMADERFECDWPVNVPLATTLSSHPLSARFVLRSRQRANILSCGGRRGGMIGYSSRPIDPVAVATCLLRFVLGNAPMLVLQRCPLGRLEPISDPTFELIFEFGSCCVRDKLISARGTFGTCAVVRESDAPRLLVVSSGARIDVVGVMVALPGVGPPESSAERRTLPTTGVEVSIVSCATGALALGMVLAVVG